VGGTINDNKIKDLFNLIFYNDQSHISKFTIERLSVWNSAWYNEKLSNSRTFSTSD